jgi:hypothetical protein
VAFKKFLKDAKIKGQDCAGVHTGEPGKGQGVFYAGQLCAVRHAERMQGQEAQAGKDLGILSHNDEPAKELIGITTYSADFSLMGKKGRPVRDDAGTGSGNDAMVLWRRNTL